MEDRGRTRAESLGSVVLGGLGMHWHPDGTGARPAPTCSRRPLAIGSPAAQCVFHPVVLKLEATLQTRLNSHRSWIMGCLRGSTIPLPSNSDIDHRQTQIDHPLNHGPSPVAHRPSANPFASWACHLRPRSTGSSAPVLDPCLSMSFFVQTIKSLRSQADPVCRHISTSVN